MAWRTARSLDKLLEQLNAAYPTRSKVSDGAIGDEAHSNSVSDHNPDPQGIVRARDFTHDPEDGLDAGRLADALLASRDPRIKYIISNGRIAASYHKPHRRAWTWGVYTGVNAHRSHVHVSVVADSRGDDTRPWAAVKAPTAQKDWLTMATEADLRRIVREEIDRAFKADVIPSPMFKGNPTMARDSALRFAAEWALQARNRVMDADTAPVTPAQLEEALRTVLGSLDK